MGDQPKVPNRVLRRIREEERQETRAEFAEALARRAAQLGEPVTPSERYVARLEDGDVRSPHPPYRRVLTDLLGRSMSELGFESPARGQGTDSGSTILRLPPMLDRRSAVLIGASGESAVIGPELVETSEWPAWFGIRLAHLVSVIDGWHGPIIGTDSIQAFLDEEILLFDSTAPDSPGSDQTAYGLARRQLLVSLAALPVTLTVSNLTETRTRGAARSLFLSRCAASITACWHLLRGSDLPTVAQILETYLLPLEGIAHRQSKYRQAAAGLASQAHRISGIIALHRNQLRRREHHCKRALYYATVASDTSSEASALISLASTYFYQSDPEQAALVYERASALENRTPRLQRSRVHAELSVVYGQLNREQDAIRSAELAGKLYPDHPEQDPSFLYAEFTPASLTLEQGLTYVALAERHPSRGYERKAAEIFNGLNNSSSASVPDRIRFEIVNGQAKAAVLLGDIDAFEAHLYEGLGGARKLGSRQRLRELQQAWQDANAKWPKERRVNALSERLQLSQSNHDQETLS
jgi:tetratricopeptide (TPR) repeat protein